LLVSMQQLPPERGDLARMLTGLSDAQVAARSRLTLGGVNHCSLHCNLARFRGLMIRGKYVAVIGLKEPIAWKFTLGTYKKMRFSTNHSAVFPLPMIIKPRNLAKRQCKLQWLTPPTAP
jgi:hypothetical protein